MRILVWIAAVLYCSYAQESTVSPSQKPCTDTFEGLNCNEILCLNGYKSKDGKTCICAPGYLGVQCEAVKTAIVPVNHFRSEASFNIMNINVWTQFWGIKTYNNIRKTVMNHVSSSLYEKYTLYQTQGTPVLGIYDEENDSDFIQLEDPKSFNSFSEFQLANGTNTGLYWCYAVKIYENIVNFVKTASLKNSVITIITQHPPGDEYFEDARRITASFGIKINVIWVSDAAYNFCTDKQSLSQIAKFQKLAENSGGLFVQIQSTEDDQETRTLISRVLMTHTKAQIVAMESRPDCSTTQSINFVVDSNIDSSYYFTFSGENATTSVSSYKECGFQNVARSYDQRFSSFEKKDPSCTSFDIQTTKGPCTAMVYTTDNLNDRTGVDIYVTYVEDPSIDASRYAIIEGVSFYPAIHIEPGHATGINVAVTSLAFVVESTVTQLQATQRPKAAYEWTSQKTIICDSKKEQHLYIGIQINNELPTQRAVRINCLSPPPVTTIAPTTTEIVTTFTSQPTTTTIAIKQTGTSSRTTTFETTTVLTTTVPTTTSIPQSTITTTTIGTTTAPCEIDNNYSTFLFAYSSDMNDNTYSLSRSAVLQAISSSSSAYSVIANVMTDTTSHSFYYETSYTQFQSDLNQYGPNNSIAIGQNMGSNFADYIHEFLGNDNSKQNSVILLLVNRFPGIDDDLEDEDYNKLTNLNIKIFSVISTNALYGQTAYLGVRSGAVLNKIAALTNGHYIIADETIRSDVTSDYSKIVQNVMNFGYNQDLLYSRNFHGQQSPSGTVRIPKASTTNIILTITISLSAIDSNDTFSPDRLLLAFQSTDNFPAVSVDFKAQTQITSSNFYIATVQLPAGVDRNLILQYQPGASQNDLLLRIWTEKTRSHSVNFVDLDGSTVTSVNNSNGASLQFTIKKLCQEKTSEIVITDCKGEVSSKYDSRQTANAHTSGEYTQFNFVPFFCDIRNDNCISGADNKYDIQLISDDYSITRSFICRDSGIKPTDNCQRKDAYGNYQCSGSSIPFKRGPTGKLNDCSGHGSLFYNENINGSYSDRFVCRCDSDQFKGDSCQEVSCGSPNSDQLAYDSNYHTYTVVLGIDRSSFLMVRDDALKQLGITQLIESPNVWKYQLLVYCPDGQIESFYTGSVLKDFRDSFSRTMTMKCSSSGSVDVTNVYNEAVRGIGNNVKGIIVYFTETQKPLNVSFDDFLATSQTYQQQLFIFTGNDTVVPLNNPEISNAAMSTGGFLIQSKVDEDNGNFDLYDMTKNFFLDLLPSQASISFAGIQQSINNFDVFFEENSIIYLMIWNHDGGIRLSGDLIGSDKCKTSTHGSTVCRFDKSYDGLKTISFADNSGGTLYDAVVYVVNDVPIKAQIISDIQKDTFDAISTTSSATQSIISFHAPDGYDMTSNTIDDSTRSSKRTNCTFQYISYSVFADSRYKKGANAAKITLQKGTDPEITRYFLFGTTDQPVCVNGGTVSQLTGSCACPNGFTGPDCSLVDCSITLGAVKNTWQNVCICTQIDDATCASAYTKQMFF